MPNTISRRTFLGAALGTAAVAATTTTAAAAASPSEERRRAVVIGTGFGGAVTALRLGEAGVQTLVLERGIRWPTGPNADTFPRMFAPDRRSAWLSPTPVLTGSPPTLFRPYTGVLDRVRGQGMDILCGAGVGGGSLVYHGMTLQPDAANFAKVIPGGIDYDEMAAEYYPRVARMLRIATIPDDLLAADEYHSSRLFVRKIEEAGLEPFRVPMPIDWNWARRELRGEMRPSYTNGDLIYGVNNGGKFSLDVTYVAAAEATGHVEVAVLHVVRDIERDNAGRWVVHTDRIDTNGTVLERKRIVTDALFLGAGSAGTTKLLMRAQGKGLVPDLPDALGTQWGNNGDRIYSWTPALSEPSPGAFQGGPACVGVKDWDNPAGALTIVHGPVPAPIDLRIASLIGFGIVGGLGEFRYDANRDDAILHWSQDHDSGLTKAIKATIDKITGNPPGTLLLDTSAVDTTTYHPLGGATIGTVCDDAGRVLGQRGLYVTDGALIPGSTGACNPSMTIGALAERSMDRIVRDDVGVRF